MTKASQSGKTNPARSKSEATRETILAAAREVFSESGLAGARTEAIAAVAGVNKALLYYYFKSKERLYFAVMENQMEDFNERVITLLRSEGPPQQILMDYVGMHFDFASNRQRYAPLHQQMLMDKGKKMEAIVRKYVVPRGQALGQLLVRGIKEGSFRPVDPRQAGISIIALIVFYFSIGPVLKQISPSDPFSEAALKHRRQEVLDFICHSLFLPPPTSKS